MPINKKIYDFLTALLRLINHLKIKLKVHVSGTLSDREFDAG